VQPVNQAVRAVTFRTRRVGLEELHQPRARGRQAPGAFYERGGDSRMDSRDLAQPAWWCPSSVLTPRELRELRSGVGGQRIG